MKKNSQKRMGKIRFFPGTGEESVKSAGGYQRRRRSPAKRMLIRVAVAALVCLLIFLVWNNWEKIAPESVLDWAAIQLGEGEEGDGYPYAVNGGTVSDLGSVNNYMALLTEHSLKFLTTDGSCVADRPHMFSAPLMETVGKYALVTEIGGSRFRLETRRETVLDKDLENRHIYAVDVNADGIVAVATDSTAQNYICGIQVYHPAGHTLYEYKTGKYLITNISLAPGGKALAAVGTYAEGGMLKAVLLVFDFKDSAPQVFIGDDVLLYDIAYFNTGKVLAVGDTAYWTVDVSDGTVEKTPYGGMEPLGYADSADRVGLVMRQSGSTGSGEVWLFDTSVSSVEKIAFDGNFRHASCRDERFLLLTDTAVFSMGGNTDNARWDAPSDALMVTEYRGQPLLLTLNELSTMS